MIDSVRTNLAPLVMAIASTLLISSVAGLSVNPGVAERAFADDAQVHSVITVNTASGGDVTGATVVVTDSDGTEVFEGPTVRGAVRVPVKRGEAHTATATMGNFNGSEEFTGGDDVKVTISCKGLCAVGGIAELPDVAGQPLKAPPSSGPSAGVVATVFAAVTAGAVALGGAAWYARRRLR